MALHAVEPGSNSVEGVSGREVTFSSESEGILTNTVNKTLGVADQVAKNWQDRIEKEGVRVWYSPFDLTNARVMHDTEKKCLDYMKKNHKASIAVAKKNGKPKAAYSPRLYIIPPKRTLEDLVTPQQAAALRRHTEAQRQVEDVRMLGLAAAGGDLKATNVVGLPEGMAIEKLKRLSDAELKLAANLAWTRGRKKVAKAAKDLCTERGIPTAF
jgi:hypothetical protein